jgi:outer membrane protein TolC
MKRTLQIAVAGIYVIVFPLVSADCLAAQEPTKASLAAPSEPISVQGDIQVADRRALKEKVRRIRREKKKRFEQITRGFIRKIITAEAVLSTEDFLRPGPRDLAECIERAVAASLASKLATERVKLAKQRILKASRDLFAEASIELEDREGSLSGQGFTSDRYNVRVKQPLFRGGTLWHTLLKEQATLRAAEGEYLEAVNDIIKKVSEAYFDSLRARRVLKDNQGLLEKANEALAMSKKKWESGLISEIEYLNVESQQSQLAHQVEESRQDAELVFLELQKHLNLELDERVDLIPFYEYDEVIESARAQSEKEREKEGVTPIDEAEFGKPLDHYIELAYENRPDLKREVNRLRANIMAKRAAQGKFFPQLDLTINFSELAEAFTDAVDDPPHQPEWQLTADVSWNLGGNTARYTFDHEENAPSVSQFQSGQGTETTRNTFSLALLDNLEDVYRVQEQEIEIMDQFMKLEEKEREMLRDVKEAYYNFRRAEIQLASETKQLLYREKVAALSKHKLEVAEIQASEYIDSEITLGDEKSEFHKAMSDYYVARSSLNRAVGIRDLLPLEKWKRGS